MTEKEKKNPFYKYLTVEDIEHISVAKFIKEHLPHVVAFHPPNEGKKSAYERYRHSLMGALKGCPDFIFLYPKFKSVQVDGKGYKEIQFFGLTIELKAPEHIRVVKKGARAGKSVKAVGKASDQQVEIAEKLNKIRYKAVISYGASEAIAVIKEYFSL